MVDSQFQRMAKLNVAFLTIGSEKHVGSVSWDTSQSQLFIYEQVLHSGSWHNPMHTCLKISPVISVERILAKCAQNCCLKD